MFRRGLRSGADLILPLYVDDYYLCLPGYFFISASALQTLSRSASTREPPFTSNSSMPPVVMQAPVLLPARSILVPVRHCTDHGAALARLISIDFAKDLPDLLSCFDSFDFQWFLPDTLELCHLIEVPLATPYLTRKRGSFDALQPSGDLNLRRADHWYKAKQRELYENVLQMESASHLN